MKKLRPGDSERFGLGLDDLYGARSRIERHVVRTPLVANEDLSRELGCELFFKCENLQHGGAFKARGACNAVLSLETQVAVRGVVTHSSGNHAVALARAAKLRGVPAHIVMPDNSCENKIEAVRSWGVEPVFSGPEAASRREMAEVLRSRTGATLIHPYNDLKVIAGQGTVGCEILEQATGIEVVVAPVGGGGLLSGVLVAVKALRPEVMVVAAEPAWADDAARSLRCGRLEMPTRYDTIADGLRTPLGELTFPIIRELVDDILLVEESTIEKATRLLAARARLVAEPSGSVALGAVMQHSARFRGRRVAAVVSGGNLDFERFELRENQ